MSKLHLLFILLLGGLLLVASGTSFSQEILLPRPNQEGQVSVEEAIRERRTIRDFQGKALSLSQLGQLLWAGQGVTERGGFQRRAAPSGGGLYPLDLYAVVADQGVSGLDSGIYRYFPKTHALSKVVGGDQRQSIAKKALHQMWMVDAPVIVAITAEYQRITRKYGERGIRYALIEVGHVGQNILLQAEALGLGAGIVGAFEDKEIASILKCSVGQDPICLLPVGYKR
jgi:SagB-type dehydrogenase family enzyme